MEFSEDTEHAPIRAAIKEICARFGDDYWAEADATHAFPWAFYDALADGGWIGYGPEYMPVSGSPRPVASDPAHPYIPNAIEYLSARPDLKVVEQSTFPVADLTNPILQPWVREELRKLNERVLAGQPAFEHRASVFSLTRQGFSIEWPTSCRGGGIGRRTRFRS